MAASNIDTRRGLDNPVRAMDRALVHDLVGAVNVRRAVVGVRAHLQFAALRPLLRRERAETGPAAREEDLVERNKKCCDYIALTPRPLMIGTRRP
jgi:hypothetical protein